MEGQAKGKSIPNTLATRKRTYDRAFSKETLDHGTLADGGSNITEAVSFLDAVLTNQVLLQTLTAQDILKCKFVCKSWESAIDDNTSFIRNARRGNCDWYFPLFNMREGEEHVGSLEMLHGMWHHHSSTSELRKLPPLAYLPPPTANACNCTAFRKDIVYFVRVSLGGLLLVETVNALWTRRCSRYPIIGHRRNRCFYHNNWPILMVTNPLTKLFEVLPVHDDEEGKHDYEEYGPDFHMMVDEIANTYKVLVLRSARGVQAPASLHVYDSGSKIWERVSPTQLPLQPSLGCWMAPSDRRDRKIYASVCSRGRLYLADLRAPTAIETGMDDRVRAVVRLFQVNIETQEQILCTQIPLGKEFNLAVKIESNAPPTDTICRNLGLVECMGRLYAVIPARLDEEVYQSNRVRQNVWENAATMGSTFMALQFYIFPLEGDVGIEGHGVLRIQLPITRKNCKNIRRTKSLIVMLWDTEQTFAQENWTPSQNWFSCTSKGNIIWVTVEDYLLQYDVLTGKSTTEILPVHMKHKVGVAYQAKQKVGMAYQASFHMKP